MRKTSIFIGALILLVGLSDLSAQCKAERFYQAGPPPCTDYIAPIKCINLDITESYDFDGLEMDFVWDMGDGNTKEGLEVEYCYDKAGKYVASLTVTDLVTKVVMKDELIVDVYIREESSLAFIPPAEVNAGEPFTPDYELLVPSNYEVTNYLWSFGDGRFSCDSLPEITYSAASTYAVVLNIEMVHSTDTIYLCQQQTVEALLPDPTGGSLDAFFANIEVDSRFLASAAEYQIVEKVGETYNLIKEPAEMSNEHTYNLLVFKGNMKVISNGFSIPENASDAERFAAIQSSAETILDKTPVSFNPLRFEINSSEFSRKMRKAADENIEILNQYPFLKVMVGSYTHTGGNYSRNLVISKERSEQVKDYLVEGGIDPARIEVADPSAQRALINTCVTKGCDYENEDLNRRTDIKVLGILSQGNE